MNKLSFRLEFISSLVDERIIADVGCDHGKLVRKLFDENKIDFAYVSDISSSSLQKAIDLLKDKKDKIKAICCDGLSGYDESKIDECIIAGMGGYEILNIIKNSKVDIQKYILAPQHDNLVLKEYLINNQYKITFDIIIKDKNKFYNIIKCEKCNNPDKLSEFELWFGKDNFENSYSAIKDYVENNLIKLYIIKQNQKTIDAKVEKSIMLFEKAKKELNYE